MKIFVHGSPVDVPGVAERALFALLLLSPGRTVASTWLVDRLWPESSLPVDPMNALQVRVSRLRRSLAEVGVDVVQRDGIGYRANVDPAAIDTEEFTARLSRARTRAAVPADQLSSRSLELYDEALSLWTGDPLSDFVTEPWGATEAARLKELRSAAVTERARIALALGRHLEVVGALEPVVAEDPTQEAMAGLLMVALYRSGRQAQALEVFARTRTVLDQDLGLEPSVSLRSLHDQVLRQDPALEGQGRRQPSPPARGPARNATAPVRRDSVPDPAGPPDRPAFGALLRSLRQRASLTQEELASRAGVTAYAVSALERGTRTRPYPHTVRALAEGLGVDEADRAALAAAARPDHEEPREAAPASTSALLVPATHLHGRHDDIDAVRGLVDGGARLVTLTGPGGVGKTRLATALCAALATTHPDGVVQVSLAPLADAQEVMPTVARTLGLTASDAAEAVDVVAAHLESRRLLLLLDNAEHLLSTGPSIGRLVAGCPHLTVLVTSRAPLRVRDEQEYAVAPLALPDAGVATLEELRAAPAGALLLDRAAAVGGALPDRPDDVTALAQICRRLAGLPLALELVSARLRVLPPGVLVERLDDVMATSGARDLPERQRTMRATLDWSHGLLEPAEQRLFTLMGAFRGGATLDAVEQVSGLPLNEVLGLLEQLVAHSLVVVRPGPAGVRYEMLEPVAQYARSLLVGQDAERAAHEHGQHFAELAERAAQGYEQSDQVDWFGRTEADEANILLAIDRCLDLDDVRTASRLTWSMWLYWWLRGQMSTGRRRADACLAAGAPEDLLGRVHLAAATMSYAAGEVASAEHHWGEATRLGEAQQDPELGCKAVAGLALAHIARGEWQPAAARLREALPLSEAAGPRGVWLGTLAHVWLGTVLMQLGEAEDAAASMGRGLGLARERGDRLATYIALYNLAQSSIAGGDPGTARAHLEEGITLSQQTGDRANLAYFVEALAVVESANGGHERVATLLGAAQALREGVGANVYMYYLPDEDRRAGAEHAARQALGEDGYDDAADRGRSLGLDDLVHVCVG